MRPHQKACFSVLLMLGVSAVQATSCGDVACSVGERVTVYATKAEPAATCPTEALADYANFELSLAAVSVGLGAKMPPSIQDFEDSLSGETKTMIDAYRKKAGVASITEAFSACGSAKGKQHVIILELPEGSAMAKVLPASGKVPYWLPRGSLDK